MHQFERLSLRDAHVGGIAYIRDTAIRAVDVVRLVMGGQSNAEILAQFPELEAEDIQEALAYAVHDLSQKMTIWGHEGAVYVHSIKGCSEVLAADDMGNHLSVAQEIHALARQTETMWNYVGVLAELGYKPDKFQWQLTSLWDIIAAAQHRLPDYGTPVTLRVDAPEALPAVRTFGYLPTAICNLAVDYWDGLLTDQAHLVIRVDNNRDAHLEIRRRYGPFTTDPSRQLTLITWSGGPVAVAALIIERHGSQLHLAPTDDGVVLSFTLRGAPQT